MPCLIGPEKIGEGGHHTLFGRQVIFDVRVLERKCVFSIQRQLENTTLYSILVYFPVNVSEYTSRSGCKGNC